MRRNSPFTAINATPSKLPKTELDHHFLSPHFSSDEKIGHVNAVKEKSRVLKHKTKKMTFDE